MQDANFNQLYVYCTYFKFQHHFSYFIYISIEYQYPRLCGIQQQNRLQEESHHQRDQPSHEVELKHKHFPLHNTSMMS